MNILLLSVSRNLHLCHEKGKNMITYTKPEVFDQRAIIFELVEKAMWPRGECHATAYQVGVTHTLLRFKAVIKARRYNICPNSCKFYNHTKNEAGNVYCKEPKDKPNSTTTIQTMKMMAMGGRKEFQYKWSRVGDPSIRYYLFDVAIYKKFVAKGNFLKKDDIAAALFCDGFVNRKKSIEPLTIDLLVKTNQGREPIFFLNAASKDKYPFAIDKKQQLAVGKSIDASRAHIPVFFQGSWDNIIEKLDGVRAVDYLDFLLYVVPTLLVPLLPKNKTRTAVMNLVQGCSIALQWELTEDSIVQMESCFDKWHAYLKEEITKKHLSKSVFTINNHYLSHIGATIRQAGSLRVYSTRSMERTIGRYAKLIKSTVYGGKNAGNIVERLATLNVVNFAVNIKKLLNVIAPVKTSLTITKNFRTSPSTIKTTNCGVH
ncbi:unnamed protein product [Mucor hiemalis]